MRDRASEFGFSIWYSLLIVLIVGIVTVGGLAISGATLPHWLSFQRQAVEQSKSFVDSTNSNLLNLKSEYKRLATKIVDAKGDEQSIGAYKAQQKAVIEQMCGIMSSMSAATVNSDVRGFVSEQGGC